MALLTNLVGARLVSTSLKCHFTAVVYTIAGGDFGALSEVFRTSSEMANPLGFLGDYLVSWVL